MDFKFKLCIIFLVTGSSISTSASAVTAASTTSTTSTSSGNKPPRPKWLHCNNCKSPFANAWDLMVHVQTAHMMNIYQLADTTKLQNVRFFFSFSFLQKQNRQIEFSKNKNHKFFFLFFCHHFPPFRTKSVEKKIFLTHISIVQVDPYLVSMKRTLKLLQSNIKFIWKNTVQLLFQQQLKQTEYRFMLIIKWVCFQIHSLNKGGLEGINMQFVSMTLQLFKYNYF